MRKLLRKGDRVKMKCENEDTGEVREFTGTCTENEIPFFDWISVDWDDSEMSSLFPSSVLFLSRIEDGDNHDS